MGIDCVWTDRSKLHRFSTHVFGIDVVSLVKLLIDIALAGFTSPVVKNGLSRCGKYIGEKYEVRQIVNTPNKPFVHVGVFGTQEERQTYLQQLARHAEQERN